MTIKQSYKIVQNNFLRPPNVVPGIIGTGAKYGLVSKVPELDNDIIEDEEQEEVTAGDEEKKEEEVVTRKQSAASFPDGSRKPSVSGSLGKDLDAVSDTVGSVAMVDIADIAKRDDGDQSPENETKNVEEEEKAKEENLSNEMKEEDGEEANPEENAETSPEEEKPDENPTEKEEVAEKAESKVDEEKEADGDENKENEEPVANGDVVHDDHDDENDGGKSEKEDSKEVERMPNAVVLPPMSSMPGRTKLMFFFSS